MLGLLIAGAGAAASDAAAGTLDRLRQDKTLRIAYRQDAPPFSFQTGSAEPEGYIVDICRAVGEPDAAARLASLSIVTI
jgi:polar amino acid transport system substrate-binding protein/glutamate/aspartate transport system substrate-binding protein